MNQELKQPVVTVDDVIKGSVVVEVLARDGTVKKITVNAMNWRTALGATFKSIDEAMIQMLENCVAKECQAFLDNIVPLHLVWLTNVAQQLTNGVDALKKSLRTATPATTGPQAEADMPISPKSKTN